MRFFRTLPVASLLAVATASSLDGRAPAPHPLDTRDVIDVCAAIDLDIKVDLLGIIIVIGVIDVCLCISAIPEFIKTNAVAAQAASMESTASITNTLTDSINKAAPGFHCVIPAHSKPACDGKNPCGFQCIDGFVPSGKECICKAPNTICNGICGHFPSCATSKPKAKREEKRWEGSGSCSDKGRGWLACGVFGGAARAWECVDTHRDLESCGGCALPLTPYTPIGVDCTSLPGVADVSCMSGSCIVHRCLPGYTRARDSSHCIHGRPAHYQYEDEEELLAAKYGLEHVPLNKA